MGACSSYHMQPEPESIPSIPPQKMHLVPPVIEIELPVQKLPICKKEYVNLSVYKVFHSTKPDEPYQSPQSNEPPKIIVINKNVNDNWLPNLALTGAVTASLLH